MVSVLDDVEPIFSNLSATSDLGNTLAVNDSMSIFIPDILCTEELAAVNFSAVEEPENDEYLLLHILEYPIRALGKDLTAEAESPIS